MAINESNDKKTASGERHLDRVLKIRLKVINRESGESRYCTVEETKAWDWGNPEFWRIVNGWQITSYKGLLQLLYLKAEKGIEEIELLEAPRFTMLSGG